MSRREPKGAERRLLDAKQARSASKLGKKKQVQLVLPGTFLPGTFIFPVEGCKQEKRQLQARSAPKLAKKTSVGFAQDFVEGCKH